MKVNLTKLLEKSDLKTPKKETNIGSTNASYYMKTIHDSSSIESAYSFELEKKTFILGK